MQDEIRELCKWLKQEGYIIYMNPQPWTRFKVGALVTLWLDIDIVVNSNSSRAGVDTFGLIFLKIVGIL